MMMTKATLDESVAVLTVLLNALSGTLVGATGVAAANLKFGIADLISNAETLIMDSELGAPLLDVFDAAYAAGASIATLETVRTTILALAPASAFARAIVTAGVQMVLDVEIATYVDTTWTSRQDVQAALDQLQAAFDAAIEDATDNGTPEDLSALIAAQSRITNHLNATARPLPKMISYKVGRVMSSLVLAQRLYGDPSRADELVAENKYVHPLFCDASGIALSS